MDDLFTDHMHGLVGLVNRISIRQCFPLYGNCHSEYTLKRDLTRVLFPFETQDFDF